VIASRRGAKAIVRQCKCGQTVVGCRGWCYPKNCCLKCSKHVHKTTDCKQCGKSFRKVKGKSFCSVECRRAHNDTKPFSRQTQTFICASCGNECTRAVRRNVTHWMCGRECQLAWTNRPVQRDWAVASRNAKKRWGRKSRKARIAKSINWSWYRLAKRKAMEIVNCDTQSEWGAKCKTASTTLGYRLTFVKHGNRTVAGRTWESLCSEGVSSGGYSTMNQWEKKCYSTYKNMKWKRRLRNARKHTSTPIVDADQQPKQLSIWEFLEIQQRDN